MNNNILADDLDHILEHTKHLWEELRDKKIFITGGTGFFGCWLLESFLRANRQFDLKAKAVVLTRDPIRFKTKVSHLANHPAVSFLTGDVRSFQFPPERFSHLIHAAVETNEAVCSLDNMAEMDVTVLGTRRILDFARQSGISKMLFISSGAVYGRQPYNLPLLPESYSGAPDPVDIYSHYAIPGEAKRAAESMCVLAAKQFQFEIKIARCFSFVGPYLPLDGKYAAGNLILDSLKGGPVTVTGDGTAVRSYLSAADLCIWLWTILFRGVSMRPYNVGSDKAITIKELATIISELHIPPLTVKINRKPRADTPPDRYVPDISRARTELWLQQHIELHDALQQWQQFLHDIKVIK